MDTMSKHMTITACPEGGFMVYSREEEHQAFAANRHLIPIAGFDDLKGALAFVYRKMSSQPDESDNGRSNPDDVL